MHPHRTENTRAVAARILGRWLENGDFPDVLIEDVSVHRAFVMEVVYGVARWKRYLEWALCRYVQRDTAPMIQAHLFVGAYQLLLMDNVEEYAAVNETVEAAKLATGGVSTGFVNAVLRSILVNREKIRADARTQKPAVRESHPDELVNRWTRQFGDVRVLDLLQWNNSRPSVCVHPLAGRATVASLSEQFAAANIRAQPHPFAPDEFLVIPHGVRVDALPGYGTGLFSIQDPATLQAIRLLDPKPGERILDACAAPGGKVILAEERMKDQGELVAMDLEESRLAILRSNTRRLRLASVRVVRGDATSATDIARAAGSRPFDRILLDVPCTNTGVLRRRPDARWRFSLVEVRKIINTQRAILDAASASLKPGGTLVYSTCSLEPEENEELIRNWAAKHRGFRVISQARLFPPDTETDGVYTACLESIHDSQNHHQ